MTGNTSVHGGRTRFLGEGDAFGHVAFFTGAEQMEASGGLGGRWRSWVVEAGVGCVDGARRSN